MNEAYANQTQTSAATQGGWTPRLSFYHPTQRGTGSAIAFEISPATGDVEGFLYVSVAAQNPTPEKTVITPTGKRCASFLWKNKICAKFTLTEVAETLMVLSGASNTAIHAGKEGFFHASADASTMIDVRQSDDPARPGAITISFTRMPKASPEDKQRISFYLSAAEALGVRLALEQSMSLLAFGMTHCDSVYARRAKAPRELSRRKGSGNADQSVPEPVSDLEAPF